MNLLKLQAFTKRFFLYLGVVLSFNGLALVAGQNVAFGQNRSSSAKQTSEASAARGQNCLQCQKWQSFSSDTILFPSKESDYLQPSYTYPKFLMWLFNGPLRWSPEKVGTLKTSCPLALKELRQSSLKQLSDDDISLIFADCSKSDFWSSFAGFVKILGVDFPHDKHPFFYPVVINLPEGQKIKGLLGLHSFEQRRPLVILRLGIFGNAFEFLGEKYLPLQLFEQGPFNVLIVESTSGSDYLEMNKSRWGLAGVDEGLQNFFIAQRLSDSREPLSKIVSSIHFLGMSLGGQGIFTTSELLRSYPNPKVKNLVAFCPVVHLEESLRGLGAGYVKGFVTDLWMEKRLGPFMQAKYGDRYKGRTWKGILTLEPEIIEEVVRLLDNNREVPAFKEWGVQASSLSAKQSLDMRSERLKLSPDVPLSIVAAKDDPIVSFENNGKKIRPLENKLSNVRIYMLEKGHHCTFPAAYDWSATAEFVKKIVTGNSVFPWKYVETTLNSSPDTNNSIEISKIDFDEETKQWKVVLSNSKFDEKIVIQMGRDDLDFDFPSDDLSEYEKIVGIRWLWQNLEVQRDEIKGQWKLRWPKYQF